ncbi:MAG: class I SAM-dependent methyltransferase [Saprospiraceae bacterium]
MDEQCLACGNIAKQRTKIKDHSISKEVFTIGFCEECGFAVTEDAPPINTIGKYYESEDYISHSDTKSGLISSLYHIIRQRMLKSKYALISRFSKRKQLLDIGSGTGYFLGYMQAQGYSVSGVEVSASAARISHSKFGIKPITPDDFLAQNVQIKYDIVTLWHVMEHLHDLPIWWNKIRSVLDDQGVLIVALPNYASTDGQHYKSFWAGYDVPRHLWHWTPRAFETMANKYDFVLIEKRHMPYDPFYNSLLSEKYKHSNFQYARAFFVGMHAWWIGLKDVDKASSVIYILRKN